MLIILGTSRVKSHCILQTWSIELTVYCRPTVLTHKALPNYYYGAYCLIVNDVFLYTYMLVYL